MAVGVNDNGRDKEQPGIQDLVTFRHSVQQRTMSQSTVNALCGKCYGSSTADAMGSSQYTMRSAQDTVSNPTRER